MPEFNIDDFKKTWQEQEVQSKYGNSEILEMLNRKSRNYVKYILWISVAEFLFFCGLSLFYLLRSEETNSFLRIMESIGVTKTPELEKDFSRLYYILKIVSLVVTAFFVVKFYLNFRKINVEANLKKFIEQIMTFRKTVNLFILTNIVLLILFTATLTLFVFQVLTQQKVHPEESVLIGMGLGILITTVLSIGLIWLYYRLVYGIIMQRLGKNLEQLKEIDTE
jgi:hypothetical protein